MTMTISEIQENLSFCENTEDRFAYIIDLGKQLSPYPEDKKDEDHKIYGCSSTIWFTYNIDKDGLCHLFFSSDALIVRGLLFIVSAIFDGKTPTEVATIDAQQIFVDLGLNSILSNQRQVGLSSVIKRVKEVNFNIPTEIFA